MNEYLLIFRLNLTDRDKQPTAAQMKRYMNDWSKWIDSIAGSGRLAEGGHHLSYTAARVLRGQQVSEGPYTVNGLGVAGYIIVMAHDLEEATGMALDCPILQGDGVVEVRETTSPGR